MNEVLGREYGPYERLLSSAEVRARCNQIGEMAMNGNASWFVVNEPRFKRCVGLVKDSCLKNYPDLKIPLHSRWRHFIVDGKDLWKHYTAGFTGDPVDLARSAVDLSFVSVLLDAGAGARWLYTDRGYRCSVTSIRRTSCSQSRPFSLITCPDLKETKAGSWIQVALKT